MVDNRELTVLIAGLSKPLRENFFLKAQYQKSRLSDKRYVFMVVNFKLWLLMNVFLYSSIRETQMTVDPKNQQFQRKPLKKLQRNFPSVIFESGTNY